MHGAALLESLGDAGDVDTAQDEVGQRQELVEPEQTCGQMSKVVTLMSVFFIDEIY